MNKVGRKTRRDADMRNEYDFSGGERGRYAKALERGYTMTIRNPDGSTTVKKVKPPQGAVVLEPDVRAYFPDSESVNRALRSLITLIPAPRKARTRGKTSGSPARPSSR